MLSKLGVIMRENFINAIHSKSKVKVTFFSREDGRNLIHQCAPMDFGPSRELRNKADRFHLWDFESDKKSPILGLLIGQIVSIEVQDENFEPCEFITWPPNWFIERDWGTYS